MQECILNGLNESCFILLILEFQNMLDLFSNLPESMFGMHGEFV